MKKNLSLLLGLLFPLCLLSQETGGPYTSDENTILLMHFNNNLSFEGAYTGNITNWGKTPVYDHSLNGLDQAFRIDNASGSDQCLLIEPTSELHLGNHWSIEFWVKSNSYGSGAAAYPSIFIKDGEGVSAISIGLRSDGLGYNCRLTFADQTEISMDQSNGLDHSKWHHITLSSDSIDNQIYFTVNDENLQSKFSDSKPFPYGTNGELITANRQVFVGGVDGSSNIQFDGWIDELRISNTSRIYHPVAPALIAETAFVEFYAAESQLSRWDEIKNDLDQWYKELLSYWERPDLDLLFDDGEKIKIYLVERNNLGSYVNFTIPDWKYGAYKAPHEIYVSIPPGGNDDLYEGSFNKLVKNMLGQLFLKKRMIIANVPAPSYFTEAFGLYYTGSRPNRESILQALSDFGRYPVISDIQNVSDITTTNKKDLMVSYIEAQALSSVGIQGLGPGEHDLMWKNHLKYYYENEDPNRIKLMKQTSNFDVYSTQEENSYLDAVIDHLENKLSRYTSVFEFPILHKINVVIYPDRETAADCIVVMDSYSFGSGWSGDKLDFISPRIDFSETTIFHELFHVFHFNLVEHLFWVPSFHSEGLAEVLTYEGVNDAYIQGNAWYYKEGLERFNTEKGHYPNLAEIIDSYEYMSVYSYGQAFWHWMKTNHTDYPTIKEFFTGGLDWNVFDISYEDIDLGFTNYLNSIAGIQTDLPDLPVLLVQSEYTEFYAPADQLTKWNEIKEDVDKWFKGLRSYWERPGLDFLFNEGEKIKIYLVEKEYLSEYVGFNFPEWRYGGYKIPNEIYVAHPPGGENDIYEGSFPSLVKNILAQLVLKKKQIRDSGGYSPFYFREGFGLLYSGYRPNQDSILQALSDLGRAPLVSDFLDVSDFSTSYKKDLMVSYLEAQALSIIGIQGINPNGHETIWERHLKHYYQDDESVRITLRKETANFNIYSSTQDIQYLDELADKLEGKLSHYETVFEFPIYHKINLVVYPDPETGMDCLVYMSIYNGGSGWSGDKLDILSPIHFEGGLNVVLDFLIPHEFFHVFHFNLVTHLFNIPAFYSEGLANHMAQGFVIPETEDDLWKIQVAFDHYLNNYSRQPNLTDFLVSEVDATYNYYNDPYFFGEAFFSYMMSGVASYVELKDFFDGDLDYSVFSKSYEEIDVGYINYLKLIAGIQTEAPGQSSNPYPLNQATAVLTNPSLSWTNGSNTDQTDLYFGTSNPPTQKVQSNVTSTSYQPSTLNYSTTYYWTVVNKNTVGNTQGPVWSFTTDVGTGIFNNYEESELLMYPNPSNKIVYISSPEKVTLSIFTLSGRKIFEKTNFLSGEINVSEFPKGVYVVRFLCEKGIVNKKLLVE